VLAYGQKPVWIDPIPPLAGQEFFDPLGQDFTYPVPEGEIAFPSTHKIASQLCVQSSLDVLSWDATSISLSCPQCIRSRTEAAEHQFRGRNTDRQHLGNAVFWIQRGRQARRRSCSLVTDPNRDFDLIARHGVHGEILPT
jgi:hypothetical protein